MPILMNLEETLSSILNISEEHKKEIRKGAYIIILDNGLFYNSNTGKTRCITEHNTTSPVYDIVGDPGNILVGLTSENHTWLQWERSNCISFQHLWDWFLYKWTGNNQGPYGSSTNTENNPIELKLNKYIIDF